MLQHSAGGVDQLLGLSGSYIVERVRQGQAKISRENNWRGFYYQKGLRFARDTVGGLSKGFFLLGSRISLYQGVKAYNSGDGFGMTKSGLDLGVGALYYGGPLGFSGGFSYYATPTLLQYSDTARYILVDKPVDMTLWLHQKTGIK